MSAPDTGVAELEPSRARLFPLPLLASVCAPPSGSARVRLHHRLHRWIVTVTNRCIATLNNMYSAATPVTLFLFLHSHLSCPCQPDNHSSFLHACDAPLPPSLPSGLSPASPSRCCSSASKAQLRLLSRLRDQCATFVLAVRSGTHNNAASDTSSSVPVDDILSSFSFAPPPAEHGQPNHPPTVPTTHVASTHDDRTSVFHRMEGVLPAASDWSSVPLPASSSFSSASTAVVQLVASRIALPDSLHIVPLVSVLPPALADVYAQPNQSPSLLRPALELFALNQTSPLRAPRVAGPRSEYVRLIGRMLAQRMVSFTASPRAVNGVFAVGKDADSDRLIIDAQPANRLFVDSPHVSLPDPSHLVQLRVPIASDAHQPLRMRVGKSDLSNYYHHIGLPAWMQPFFALPPLTPAELQQLGLPLDSSFPTCATLPMGFSHAVFLAQSSHEHVLYSSSAVDPRDNLLRMCEPDVTQDRVTHGIEIDDFFIFSLNQTLAEQVLDRVLAAYRAAGFVVKESKVTRPTTQPVKVIGYLMCGRDATMVLAPDARISLLSATLTALRRGELTGLDLAHVIGRWTWCMLCRRASLAALQHVYRFIEVAHRRRFTLWPSVRRELWMLVGLMPLMPARLDAPIFNRVVASDASELAGGVVCTALTQKLEQTMWPLCSSRAHATMQALVRKHDVDIIDDDVRQQQLRQLVQSSASFYDTFYASVAAAPWSTIISTPWRVVEHINALELRAALLSLHWLLSFPSSHSSRVFLLVDSMVTYFTLWKGRSSSARLLLILRKISALLLASGVSLLTGWLPSEVNPADAPSRLQ